MRYLVDTNILLRIHDPIANPHYAMLQACLADLWTKNHTLCCTMQNIAEFWSASTRPKTARGGLGISHAETERRVGLIERQFSLLEDGRDVYDHWRRLLIQHEIKGVQVHDAKLVASMLAHGVTHLLTLNAADFKRYPDIVAVTPGENT